MSAAEDTLLDLAGMPPRSPGQRLADLPNPLSIFGSGLDRILDPDFPLDAKLKGWRDEAPIFKPTMGGMLKGAGLNLLNPATSFAGGLKDLDKKAVMESSLLPLAGMTVYHGSPHLFDAFKMSKIGTGEGAQAYGHGLYFAENPGVAKGYQEMLSSVEVKINGKPFSAEGIEGIAESALMKNSGDLSATKSMLMKEARVAGKGSIQEEVLDFIEKNSSSISIKRGNLYHVDIPDEHIAKMLDWDKPLSEQAPEVQKKLAKVIDEKYGDGFFEDYAAAGNDWKDARDNLFDSFSEADVSNMLKEAGIPGTKYLDAGSRSQKHYDDILKKFGDGDKESALLAAKAQLDKYGKAGGPKAIYAQQAIDAITTGPPTRNIVLFDESLAKILKRE